jgi:hypothetical protein
MSSQKIANLGEIRQNGQNFARKFLRANLTARIRPFRTSFAKKKYCENHMNFKIKSIFSMGHILTRLSKSEAGFGFTSLNSTEKVNGN